MALVAEGLPIILESAQGYWQAAACLGEMMREREVMVGLAEEEAAKILILVDIVRCPVRLVGSRVGPMMTWFYDHFARLLYSQAQSWQPVDLRMLQDYLDRERRSHYIEGYVGEYVLPNELKHSRDSLVYADVALQEDGEPFWNQPSYPISVMEALKPKALTTAEALSRLGLLSAGGLRLLAEVWRSTAFVDGQTAIRSDELVIETLNRTIDAGLPSEDASETDIRRLRCAWQMPMYSLDFTMLDVSLQELKQEQECAFCSEVGK